VSGLSPLEAGLWSLPSAIAFVIGSQLAPRIVQRIAAAHLISGGLGVAAVGLLMLTRVGPADGLSMLIISSVVISAGLAPVFGLTTGLVVGSAPPERAGAASGISETAAELGGALGIAILGSIGIALYREQVGDDIPADVPASAAAEAGDTLGAAVAAADQLNASSAETLLELTREAFVSGMQLSAAIAAVIAVAVAVLALVGLRKARTEPVSDHGDTTKSPGESAAATEVEPSRH